MHRRGHVGMALLAYAPVGFVLLTQRQLGLALLGLLGVLFVEPLPDNDFWIPGLRHRGTSHSLLCALVVGGVIGAFGWVVGDRVAVFVASVLAGLDTSAVGIFAGLAQWVAEQLRALDGRTLATFGFAVGVFGVLVHLLGDALTVGGIRPLLPLSPRRVALTSIHSGSPAANNVLLGLGVFALAAVFFATAPGIGFVGASTALSPVDVAAGQSPNASNATAVFENQTTNGSAVTVERVTLLKPGFVAIHTGGYATGPAPAESSIIAVSDRLDAGTHRNVTVEITNAPPANYPGMNRSRLNESQTLAAVAYRDTNGNARFDFVRSVGETDGAYTSDGAPVSDTAGIAVPSSEQPQPTASVAVADQQLRNNSLVVRRARLPAGGFLVAHNASYQRTGDPLSSAVGISGYLPRGRHRNITLDVLPSALNRPQTVTVRPARDTNNNQRYDYIRSNGFQDIAYSTANQSATVAATAQVNVPSARTRTTTQIGTATESPTATAIVTTTDTAIPSPAPSSLSGNVSTMSPSATTETGATTTTTTIATKSDGGIGSSLPSTEIIGGLVVLIVIALLIWWLR